MATEMSQRLFEQYIKPRMHPHKVTVTFPEPLCFAMPLATTLMKLADNNPDINALTPKDLGGFDLPSEYGAIIGHKRHRGMVAYIFVNEKPIFIDYQDPTFFRNSSTGKVFRAGGPDAVDGAIKFHFGLGNYADSPWPVYPFIYPGPNDFKTVVPKYPMFWDAKYRQQYLESVEKDEWYSNMYCRWDANFKTRKIYTALAQDLPDVDVKNSKRTGESVDVHTYMDRISKSKFSISARGSAKFSHREIEILSMGVPLMYEDGGGYMWRPLVEGKHFIGITPDTFVDQFNYYLNHYDEVVQIAANGYEWYQNNHTQRGMQNVFNEILDCITGVTPWKQL